MSKILMLIVAVMLIMSCHRSPQRLNVPHMDREYGYIRMDDGTVLVLDISGKGLEIVRKLVNCPCVLERLGTVYRLTPAKAAK